MMYRFSCLHSTCKIPPLPSPERLPSARLLEAGLRTGRQPPLPTGRQALPKGGENIQINPQSQDQMTPLSFPRRGRVEEKLG